MFRTRLVVSDRDKYLTHRPEQLAGVFVIEAQRSEKAA